MVVGLLVPAMLPVLGGCSGGREWPTATDRYVPPSLGDQRVTVTPFAESLATSIVDADVRSRSFGSYGAVTGGDPLPAGLLIAVSGREITVTRTLAKLRHDLAGDPEMRRTTTDDGVAVDSGKFRQGDREIAVAIARPSQVVGLASLSFDGDRSRAAAVVTSMLRLAGGD